MKLIFPESILDQHLVALGKVCTKCNVEKPVEEFGLQKARNGKSYRRPYCKRCDVVIAAQYRLTPKGKASRQVEGRKRFQAILGLYKLVKAQQQCLLCGERDIACIDFHHLVPASKRREVVDSLRCSFKRFITEVCKCICLCANCHRKLHAGRVQLPADVAPLKREWIEACAAVARVKAGLPADRKIEAAA